MGNLNTVDTGNEKDGDKQDRGVDFSQLPSIPEGGDDESDDQLINDFEDLREELMPYLRNGDSVDELNQQFPEKMQELIDLSLRLHARIMGPFYQNRFTAEFDDGRFEQVKTEEERKKLLNDLYYQHDLIIALRAYALMTVVCDNTPFLGQDLPGQSESGKDFESAYLNVHESLKLLLYDYGNILKLLTKGDENDSFYSFFTKLLNNAQFPAHNELTEFLLNELWYQWRQNKMRYGSDLSRELDQQNWQKTILTSLIKDAAWVANWQGDGQKLGIIMEELKNCEQEETAKEILFDPRLDDEDEEFATEDRLFIAVNYINAFGYTKAIDLIAARIADLKTSDRVRGQLMSLYNILQGDTLAQIMTTLHDVYDRVDFAKYALNSEKLTRDEVDFVEGMISDFYNKEKPEVDVKDIPVLGIAEGTGRHCMELAKRGYRNLTALEYEEKHLTSPWETLVSFS